MDNDLGTTFRKYRDSFGQSVQGLAGESNTVPH